MFSKHFYYAKSSKVAQFQILTNNIIQYHVTLFYLCMKRHCRNWNLKYRYCNSLNNLPKGDNPNGGLVETQVKGHVDDGHLKSGSPRPRWVKSTWKIDQGLLRGDKGVLSIWIANKCVQFGTSCPQIRESLLHSQMTCMYHSRNLLQPGKLSSGYLSFDSVLSPRL